MYSDNLFLYNWLLELTDTPTPTLIHYTNVLLYLHLAMYTVRCQVYSKFHEIERFTSSKEIQKLLIISMRLLLDSFEKKYLEITRTYRFFVSLSLMTAHMFSIIVTSGDLEDQIVANFMLSSIHDSDVLGHCSPEVVMAIVHP